MLAVLHLDVEEHVRLFKGHSGCRVELWRRADLYFVRKWSASPTYNPRFQRQIDKQIALSDVIAVPRIFRQSEAGGLVVADMEFVTGEHFRSYAPQQRIDSVVNLVDQIIAPLVRLQSASVRGVDAAEFEGKLAELKLTVAASAFFKPHAQFLNSLLERMGQLDWTGIPESTCHGDLTLENILIQENGIVFIDPLDGAMNSVWLDIAKLVQDLNTGWSLRNLLWEEEQTPEARLLRMLTRYLSEELLARLAPSFPDIGAHLAQLRALQALRVLPYVKDVKTFSHVVDGLKHISL